jgi:hypothetical protein
VDISTTTREGGGLKSLCPSGALAIVFEIALRVLAMIPVSLPPGAMHVSDPPGLIK